MLCLRQVKNLSVITYFERVRLARERRYLDFEVKNIHSRYLLPRQETISCLILVSL